MSRVQVLNTTKIEKIHFAVALIATIVTSMIIPYQTYAPQGRENSLTIDPTMSSEPKIDVKKLDGVGLPFIENQGQVDREVKFYASTFAGTVFVTEDGLTYALLSGASDDRVKGLAVKETFLKTLHPTGSDKSSSIVNYFVGEEENWRYNVPTYNAISLGSVWPSIDVELRAYGNNIEKVFKVAPGGSTDDIRLAMEGVRSLNVDEGGELLLETKLGTVAMTKPLAYQDIDGMRKSVEASYSVEGNTYGFVVGQYDPRYTLVIDPLIASTFIGGSNFDEGFGIDLDTSGNVFVTGHTNSGDYPTTPGAFDTSFNGADVFVTKLDSALKMLLASTYIGGSNFEEGNGIALDTSGNVFVTGFTNSGDYPTTPGAFDTSFNSAGSFSGEGDVFVTKLNNALTGPLLASTYIGGSDHEEGNGIALDTLDNVFVTGRAFRNYPTTPGAFDTTFSGGVDAFVTKLNNALTGPLLASTYIGGGRGEIGQGIALDTLGNVFVTGETSSADYPTTPGAFDTTFNGGFGIDADVFVTKLNNALTGPLLASTYIGGSLRDVGNGIALDTLGNVFVTGNTQSSNYPTTPGAFDTTLNGPLDAFVTKLNNALTGPLLASTYIGGSGSEVGLGIALDTSGNVFVTGLTSSADYPTTPGAFDTISNGSFDVFVTKLNNALTGPLLASTYIGGNSNDLGSGIALDTSGNVFVTGFTRSVNYPTTPGAFDTTFNVGSDVFVSKFTGDLAGAPPPAFLSLSPTTDTNTVGTDHCVTATVTDASGNPVPGVTVVFSVTGSNMDGGSDTTDAAGQATFCYTGNFFGEDAITAFADTNEDGDHDPGAEPGEGEPIGAAAKTWTLPVSTELCSVMVTEAGIITASNGDMATFRGNAKVSASGEPTGEQAYRDHGPVEPMNVKSINVLAVVCSDDLMTATIFGEATIDGTGSHKYRIDVEDHGNSGASDTYWILISKPYDSGRQTLEGGNVVIHKETG